MFGSLRSAALLMSDRLRIAVLMSAVSDGKSLIWSVGDELLPLIYSLFGSGLRFVFFSFPLFLFKFHRNQLSFSFIIIKDSKIDSGAFLINLSI